MPRHSRADVLRALYSALLDVRQLCLDAALVVAPHAPGLRIPRGDRVGGRWPHVRRYAPADPIADARRRLRNATRRARVIEMASRGK